ncbi:MAG TPA: hypothetical protein VFJ11_06245 [Gaiellaceae bacterium]|nr:hypothetical protein [Gaiellaceae bacterium]
MNGGEKRGEGSISAEAAGTLVWLLDNQGVDRRRYAIVNRLRRLRDSEEFATLPESLRQRVREIIDETDR